MYVAEFGGRHEPAVRYTFEVMSEPIPVVAESTHFDAEIGALAGQAKERFAAVLAVHVAAESRLSSQ